MHRGHYKGPGTQNWKLGVFNSICSNLSISSNLELPASLKRFDPLDIEYLDPRARQPIEQHPNTPIKILAARMGRQPL